jgi:hypothetical protein
LLCCVAPDGESDFLKDRWLPGTWGSCRSARNAERVPLGFNRRIARIFLDAAHDDLERLVRKQPLQTEALEVRLRPVATEYSVCLLVRL